MEGFPPLIRASHVFLLFAIIAFLGLVAVHTSASVKQKPCPYKNDVCEHLRHCSETDWETKKSIEDVEKKGGLFVKDTLIACQKGKHNGGKGSSYRIFERHIDSCKNDSVYKIARHLKSNAFRCRPQLNSRALAEVLEIVKEVDHEWRDRNGFIRQTRIQTPGVPAESDNQNPTLFTAQYIYLLHKLGVLKGDIRKRYLTWAKAAISELELEPGLFDRKKDDRAKVAKDICSIDHFSRDEQIGLVVMDRAFDWDLGTSKRLLDYGKRNKIGPLWYYENLSWVGVGQPHRNEVCHGNQVFSGIEAKKFGIRQPNFSAFLKVANGGTINPVAKIWFVVAFARTEHEEITETGGKILGLLRAEIMKRSKSSWLRAKVAAFYERMRNDYGDNALHELLKRYHGPKSADHPLIRLSSYAPEY